MHLGHMIFLVSPLAAGLMTQPAPAASTKPNVLIVLTDDQGYGDFSSHGNPVQYSRAKLEKWECAVIWNQWRLVYGKELYNIREDRAQASDLAASRPEITTKLRGHYDRWWNNLGGKIQEFVPISIGSSLQLVVALTSSDWQDVYADNAGHVRSAAGGPRGGHWNILVEREGDYEIALRRWPLEVDLPLGAESGPKSKALPISAARMTAAGLDASGKASPAEKEVILRLRLPAGRTRLQAWFQDAAGEDLCGAYHAYIRRREK